MVPVELITYFGVALSGAFVLQSVVYMLALRGKRVDIVDVAWGLSFIAIIAALWLYKPPQSAAVYIADALVVVWGTRLAWHIGKRFMRSQRQDERYTQLMTRWPKQFVALQLFFKIFALQAVLATIISLPMVALHVYQPNISWVVIAGISVWVIGFIFEAVADWQLARFLQQPQHPELMTTGVWRYSRHPNYFGEMTMWWGIAIMSFATPAGWMGVVGAATITWLLVFVSGVPLAEASARRKKGWQAYVRTTSMLLPLPPRRN